MAREEPTSIEDGVGTMSSSHPVLSQKDIDMNSNSNIDYFSLELRI